MTVGVFLLGCSLLWWCLFAYVLRYLTRVDRACLREWALSDDDSVEVHLRKTRIRRGVSPPSDSSCDDTSLSSHAAPDPIGTDLEVSVIPSEESLRTKSRNLNADNNQKQDSSTSLGMTS